ncbi:hypothetical protein NPIL_164161 [Nephila pilipes]|uniref:Endonuclease/exonuclease/phosphatase domain-containing protein n=1 Tax=Nephila pilipes TaxID=299642 RepID=A0A8X6TA91_NEPPI|nr:hypothetical protein NPIL_164161 [Nephila pilipes]
MVVLLLIKIVIPAAGKTKLNPNLKFTIKDYITLHKDRKNRSGDGLAFLIKSTVIKFREVLLPPNFQANSECSTEAHVISITLPPQKVTIVNTYHPDNTNIDVDLLNSLVDTNSGTRIILGDFNVPSPSWGSLTLDSKGSQIEDLLCDIDFSILNNKKNIYLSKINGTATTLEVTAINHQSAEQTTWQVLERAIRDHFPILTKINHKIDGTLEIKGHGILEELIGENSFLNLKGCPLLVRQRCSKIKKKKYRHLLCASFWQQKSQSLESKEETTGSPIKKMLILMLYFMNATIFELI